MSVTRETLVAELLADAIRSRRGGVGVMVRDVPGLEPEAIAKELFQLSQEGIELRVAYLQDGAAHSLTSSGFPPEYASTDVEQAERWRNQRDLTALVVVIATGTEDKLSSLEDFATIVIGRPEIAPCPTRPGWIRFGKRGAGSLVGNPSAG